MYSGSKQGTEDSGGTNWSFMEAPVCQRTHTVDLLLQISKYHPEDFQEEVWGLGDTREQK